MFDQANRSVWLAEQLWPRLRDAFPTLKLLPREALITVGYPSSGARGRSDKIRPCEVNKQWTGNQNEQVFLSVHPVYFDTPINVAKALLFGTAKFTGGARWGAEHVGLTKHDDGTIEATSTTQVTLEAIIADTGEPPAGFGLAFPVRSVQRARLRKYVAQTVVCSKTATSHPIIRAASDDLHVACQDCGVQYDKE